MGLFSRKKKSNSEEPTGQESSNKVPEGQMKQAKEMLASTALQQLDSSDVGDFANTKVEFGYIYMRGDDYESLFKVITDKTTTYFAAQQGKLMRLQNDFGEGHFQATVEQMNAMHGDWQ